MQNCYSVKFISVVRARHGALGLEFLIFVRWNGIRDRHMPLSEGGLAMRATAGARYGNELNGVVKRKTHN